jgi:DNA-binding transcriptional MocR family regulator
MPKNTAHGWIDEVQRGHGPVYAALAQTLEAAIRDGRLHPGDRLPPQRDVARRLGVDLTTVTRAYTLAKERGLLEGAVGRGSFVKAPPRDADPILVDLSMNLPPPPLGLNLGALLRETTDDILRASDASVLMAYSAGAGTAGQRAAGARWLAPVLGDTPPDRMLIAPGAQGALAAIFSALLKRGDTVVVDALTYPGVIALARTLGLTLLPCPTDADGLIPDALEALCAQHRPAAIYIVPTLQNPTTATLTAARREAVAAIARRFEAWIVEDDPYSLLMPSPPAAIATFAPERTVYVGSLAKTLTPGLRIAYIAAPPDSVGRIGESLRALAVMPAPLMAAVTTRWIQEGLATTLLLGVRAEAAARRALAARLLPTAIGGPESIHVWLPLSDGHSAKALTAAAQARGLALVTGEAFAVGADHPNGARISFGGPARRAVLEKGLRAVAELVGAAGRP